MRSGNGCVQSDLHKVDHYVHAAPGKCRTRLLNEHVCFVVIQGREHSCVWRKGLAMLAACLFGATLGACGGGGSPVQPAPPASPTPAAAPIPALRPELKAAIEALFLGTGALAPRDGFSACPSPGRWTAFPRGTRVRIRVSTTVSPDKLAAIQDTASEIPIATNGAISASVEVVDDPDPRPGTNEVTSTANDDPVAQGCPFDRGCIQHVFQSAGVLRGGRAVQPRNQTTNAFAHDVIGHGIVGMCHIDGHLIGGPERSLMSGGPDVFSGDTAPRLSTLDIEAARAVYASSLNPGATRAEFVGAGLIDP